MPLPNTRAVNMYGETPYPSKRTRTTAWPRGVENPWHGWASVAKQVADNMTGFVDEYAAHEPQLIIDYYTDAELPAYGALTREFAICDRWHCSHLGGTLPNRFISLTGDLTRNAHGSPEPNNPLRTFTPLEDKTFFDHLTANGVTWKLFEHGYSRLERSARGLSRVGHPGRGQGPHDRDERTGEVETAEGGDDQAAPPVPELHVRRDEHRQLRSN